MPMATPGNELVDDDIRVLAPVIATLTSLQELSLMCALQCCAGHTAVTLLQGTK